jgi:hypothetical protein
MKKIYLTATLLVFSVFYFACFSQISDLIPKIIPPSPEAANFAKFTEIPINTSTGGFSHRVAIQEIKRGKLSTSVSVDYHGSGIKLEENASWCGLGWALNGTGGLVARSVRGRPDDGRGSGFLTYSVGKTVQSILNMTGQARLNEYEDIVNGCVDAEPDLFYVNANGMNFHFAFEWNNGGIKFSTDQKIKIEYSQNSAGAIIEFRIIDDKGTTYIFNALEKTTETPYTTHCYTNQNFTSAWYLTQMKDINSENFIYFDYDDYVLDYDFKSHETYKQLIGGSTECGYTDYIRYRSKISIAGKRISQIRTDDNAIKVIFSPSTDDRTDNGNLFGGPNGGSTNFKKLDRITVKDYNDNEIKSFKMDYTYETGRLTLSKIHPQNNNVDSSPPHEFYYNGALPNLSPTMLDQDHWGYFNGASNTTLLPPAGVFFDNNSLAANREPSPANAILGSLTKIVSPTAGIIELDLEAHDYGYVGGNSVNEYVTTPVQYTAFINGQTANNTTTTISQNFTISPNPNNPSQSVQILLHIRGHNNNGIGILSNSNFNPTLGRPAVRIVNSANVVVYPQHNIQMIDEDFNESIFLTPGNYILQANCTFYDPQASTQDFAEITASFYDYTTMTLKVKPAGGVRVKEQRIYRNSADTDFQTIRYKYKMSSDPTRSSGTINNEPFYNYIKFLYCLVASGNGFAEKESQYLIRSGQNRAMLSTIQDSHVIYREVEVQHFKGINTNGKSIHQFSSYYDIADGFNYNLPIVPVETQNFKRNLLQNQQDFKQVASTTSVFKTNDVDYLDNSQFVLGLRVDALGGFYNASNFDNRFLTAGYVTFLGHSKPTQTIEVMDGVSKTTTMAYDANLQNMTFQTMQTSNQGDNALVTEMYYPQDFPTSTLRTAMLNANFVGVPLETVSKRVNTTTNISKIIGGDYQIYDFTTKLRLQQIQKLNLDDAITSGFQYAKSGTPDTRYTTEISFNNYDDKGNIREYALRGTRKSAFLWGYKSLYPLAEIKEASFAQVTAALATFGQTPATLAAEENETTLQNYMGQLRAALPNAFVNAYTYIPLVGLSTVTDFNGYKTTYQYDNFKRLQTVKDHLGNILKNYNYQYENDVVSGCSTPAPVISSAPAASGCQSVLTASGCVGGTVNWSNQQTGASITVPSVISNIVYTATCTTTCESPASNALAGLTYPAGWTADNIVPAVSGCIAVGNNVVRMQTNPTANKGIGGSDPDHHYFYSKVFSGDVTIMAKVNGLSAGSGIRAGLMFKAGLGDKDVFFSIVQDGDNSNVVGKLYRQTTNDNAFIGQFQLPLPANVWLRIKKVGATVRSYYSTLSNPNINQDSDWIENLTSGGSALPAISFGSSFRVGMTLENPRTDTPTATVTFTNIQIDDNGTISNL